MKLNTGRVSFEIVFDNGDKGVIYFNPHDRDFIKRMIGFEESAKERAKNIDLEKYKPMFENDDGITIDINNLDALMEMTPEQISAVKKRMTTALDIEEEYNNAIKTEIDEIFKSNVSSIIFKHCPPMDMVHIPDENGEIKEVTFLEHFMTEFMKELKKYQENISTGADKHIKKYKK